MPKINSVRRALGLWCASLAAGVWLGGAVSECRRSARFWLRDSAWFAFLHDCVAQFPRSAGIAISVAAILPWCQPRLQSFAAADWTIEDLDGDQEAERLLLRLSSSHGAAPLAEIWLSHSRGQQVRMLVLEAGEAPAFELCGSIDDMDNDGAFDFIITTVRATEDGGQQIRARLLLGPQFTYAAQIVGGWSGSGVQAPTLIQMPGDIVPTGAVDDADLEAFLAAATDSYYDCSCRAVALAADWDSDGELDPVDMICMMEKVADGPRGCEVALRFRLEQILSGQILDIGAIFRLFLRLLGAVDCVWCAEHFAQEMEDARAWIQETNAMLRECIACIESGDCPIEQEVECWQLYNRVQGEWAERCSRLGQGAGPCIRKCAGALEVLP